MLCSDDLYAHYTNGSWFSQSIDSSVPHPEPAAVSGGGGKRVWMFETRLSFQWVHAIMAMRLRDVLCEGKGCTPDDRNPQR